MSRSKKIFMSFFVLLGFMVPLTVKADVEITSVTIDAPQRVSYKQNVPVAFNIRFKGLDPKATTGKGIYKIAFEFTAPANIVSIGKKADNEWETEVYSVKGTSNTYLVTSTTSELTPNLCSDKFLGCGDYKVNLNFYIKERYASFAEIEFKEAAVSLSPIESDEVLQENLSIIEYNNSVKKTISISEIIIDVDSNSSNLTIEELPSTNIEDAIKKDTEVTNKTPIQTPTKPTTPSAVTPVITENVDLKSLHIKDYPFDFYKDKENYKILIEKDVNSVEVEAIAEDEKAKVEIIGAGDLKANDYKIKVQVSSGENKKIYIIEALQDSKKRDEEKITLFNRQINKKYVVYGIIAFGIIIVCILLKVIYSVSKKKFENRKINKALKEIGKKK